MLALLPSNVVATALPLLRGEWVASAAEMGAVFAAYQVGYVAAVVFLLPLTDKVPAPRVIVGCSLASTAAFLLFPVLAHDPFSAAVLRALAGVLVDQGVTLLWATARASALGFYRRMGLSVAEGEFVVPETGFSLRVISLDAAGLAALAAR
jgi:MFS family permease